MEESRDLMREADLVDRKVERERIKGKHKEQRRKMKKRRREEQVTNWADSGSYIFFFLDYKGIHALSIASLRGC